LLAKVTGVVRGTAEQTAQYAKNSDRDEGRITTSTNSTAAKANFPVSTKSTSEPAPADQQKTENPAAEQLPPKQNSASFVVIDVKTKADGAESESMPSTVTENLGVNSRTNATNGRINIQSITNQVVEKHYQKYFQNMKKLRLNTKEKRSFG
jgi:hypothetical protein